MEDQAELLGLTAAGGECECTFIGNVLILFAQVGKEPAVISFCLISYIAPILLAVCDISCTSVGEISPHGTAACGVAPPHTHFSVIESSTLCLHLAVSTGNNSRSFSAQLKNLNCLFAS